MSGPSFHEVGSSNRFRAWRSLESHSFTHTQLTHSLLSLSPSLTHSHTLAYSLSLSLSASINRRRASERTLRPPGLTAVTLAQSLSTPAFPSFRTCNPAHHIVPGVTRCVLVHVPGPAEHQRADTGRRDCIDRLGKDRATRAVRRDQQRTFYYERAREVVERAEASIAIILPTGTS